MRKRIFHRVVAGMMAAMLTLQSPVSVMAQEVQKPKQEAEALEQTENVEADIPETDLTELETDDIANRNPESSSEDVAQSEEEVHVPVDVTMEMEQLQLELSKSWYQDPQEEKITLSEQELDFRGISKELLSDETKTVTAGMSLEFRLLKDGEERSIHAGDWFVLQLPVWMKNARFTEEEPVCMDESEALIEGITWEFDEKKEVLKAVFTEEVDKQEYKGIHGEIGVTFDLERSVLKETEEEQKILLQSQEGKENLCVMYLPAMPKSEEPKEQENSEEQLEAEVTQAAPEKAAENSVTIERDGKAEANVIWQDRVAPEKAHEMLGGSLICTATITKKDVSGNETTTDPKDPEELHFGADGVLSGDTYAGLAEIFGWNQENPAPTVKASGENTLNQKVYVENLPTKRVEKAQDGTITTYEFAWELVLTTENLPKDYLLDASKAAQGTYMVTPTTTFSAIVELRSGDTLDEEEWEEVRKNIQTYTNVGEIADVMARFGTEISISLEATEKSGFKTLKITGIPWCDEAKNEIIYSAAVKEKNTDKKHAELELNYDESGDKLVQSIDNASSSNFGSVTSEVHEGGSLALTRQGTVKFIGTKYWLDDNIETIMRPETTWELWRYIAGQNDSYQQGAPVYEEDGSTTSFRIPAEKEDGKKYEAGEAIPVTFEDLPKYDAEGQEYIYFAKETMTGESASHFEKVFGAPAGENHTIDITKDMAPNWISHAELMKDDIWVRGTDSCIYNEGVLCNRLKGDVEVKMRKEWKAAHYQEDLEDVEITFTLERCAAGVDDSEAPENWEVVEADGKPVTEVMSGFSAENLTGTIITSMPRYDEIGRELKYRWVETEIKKGEEIISAFEEGGKTGFRLPHNIEAQAIDGKEYYISEMTEEDGEQIIINTLQGTTQYDVKKVWGAGVTPTPVTIILKGTAAGQTIEKSYTLTEENKQSDGSWEYVFKNLPKYDGNGKKYEYTVEEIDAEGRFSPDYVYNDRDTAVDLDEDGNPIRDKENDVNAVTITNQPVGEGKQIRIRKTWLDGGEAPSRKPVYLNVYRKGVDGNPLGEEDKLLAENVKLTEQDKWWSYVNVTEYEVTYEGHTYVGSKDAMKGAGVPDDVLQKAAVYEGEYYIEETGIGKSADEFPVNTEQLSSRGYPTIAGTGLKYTYEVIYANPVDEEKPIYGGQDAEGFYTVSNHRFGRVDVAVTKSWVDGNKSAEERNALGADIELVNREDIVKFQDNGNGTSGMTLKNEPDGIRAFQQDVLGEDGKTSVSHIQKLNGDENGKEATLYFYGLPKYDYWGDILHYELKENCKDDSLQKNDYTVSMETSYGKAEDSELHGSDGHDSQKVTVTNQRAGTKKVQFHKKWIDKSVYEEGNRPDIFLTLYVQSGDGELKPSEYIDRKWEPHVGEGDPSNPADTNYEWNCDFDFLPKYDERGAEITYYAIETTHAPTKQFDYLPVQYGLSKEENGRLSTVGWDGKEYTVTHTSQTADDGKEWILETENGEQALKENGWFINEIRENIIIDGKKVWENIPAGFPVEELPRLNFYVDRTLGEQKEEGVAEILDVESTGTDFTFKFKYTGENDKDGNRVTGASETKKGSGMKAFFRSLFGGIGKAEEEKNEDWRFFLPKYNPKDGELYEYTVRETISQSENTENLNTAYEQLPGEVHNYVITNTYNVNEKKNRKGHIAVSKEWDSAHTGQGVGADEINAEAAFDLYRFYLNKAGTEYLGTANGNGELVETVYLNPMTGQQEAFEPQLIKAPNGQPYIYYVKERNIDGFAITDVRMTGGSLVEKQDGTEGWPKEALERSSGAFVFEQNTTDTGDSEYTTVEVSAKNTYRLEDGDVFTIKAGKTWKDLDNLTNTRPEQLTFSLNRYADRQAASGWDNSIAKETAGTLTLTKNGESLMSEFVADPNVVNVKGEIVVAVDGNWSDAVWTITLKNLDRYAPNGSSWRYELEEEELTSETLKGYNKRSPEDGVGRQESAKETELTFNAIENSNTTELIIEKEWNQNEELPRYETAYTLQVSDDDGATWNWAETYFKDSFPDKEIPFELKATISAENTTVSFGDLPANAKIDDTIKPLTWRAVETRIGENEIAFDGVNYKEQEAGVLYEPTQGRTEVSDNRDSQKCKITNTPLNGVKILKITKKWANDHQNKFSSRPVNRDNNWEVQYLIQRKTESTDYVNVTKKDGTPYVVTVTGQATVDSKTLDIGGLPSQDASGNPYTYIAREVIEVKAGTGSQWEIIDNETHSLPGYVMTTDETDQNVVTNTYQMTERSFTKTWVGDEELSIRPTDAVFTLWVKEGNDGAWQKAEELWKNAGEFSPAKEETGEESRWIYRYSNLPKIAPNGEEYVYGVSETTTTGYSTPVYGNDTATQNGTTIMRLDKEQSKNHIANHVTAFTMQKQGMGDVLPNFSEVELKLTGMQGTATENHTAIWRYKKDQNGQVTSTDAVKGLPLGTYTLSETKTPEGYIPLTAGYTVTLSGDGKGGTEITIGMPDGIGQEQSLVSAENNMITVKNKPTEFSLLKTDSKDETSKLSGAEFALTGEFPARYGDEKSYTLVTGDDGMASVKEKDASGKEIPLQGLLIVGETYTLKETKAPDNYQLQSETLTFTVESNGVCKSTTPPAGYSVLDGNKITVVNEKISLKVKKVNESGEPLSGATFRLEVVNPGTKEAVLAKNMETGEDGSLDLFDIVGKENLVVGKTYKLTETKAPQGYVLPDAEERSAIFTINDNGTIAWEEPINPLFAVSDTGREIIVSNLHAFSLKKFDNETSTELLSDDLELTVKDMQDRDIFTWKHTDAGYQLTKKTEETRYRYLSVDSGSGVIKGLPTGAYKLEESRTPVGYATIKAFEFTLDNENGMTVNATSNVKVETEDALPVLKVTDDVLRGHVTLTKTMETKPLAGVQFDLYRINGNIDGAAGGEKDEKDEKILSLTTGDRGTWTTMEEKKEGLKIGKYYFKETRETADSILKAEPIEFEIAGKTNGAVVGQPDMVLVNAENTAFEGAALSLTKFDEMTGTVIDGGVKFRLKKTSNDADGIEYAAGNTVTPYEEKEGVILEIGRDGTVTFEGLTKGTYHLKEVSAKGYEASFEADVIIGRADAGRAVQVCKDDEHLKNVRGTLTEQGVGNARKTAAVTLKKTDATDEKKALNGVEFSLQKKEGDTYKDCMSKLFTGNSYVFQEGTESTQSSESSKDGTLELTGIPWGDYKLVEKISADGYVITDEENQPIEKEFTVNRDSFDENNNAQIFFSNVENRKTTVTLRKQGEEQQPLSEAEFTIRGDRFAGEEDGIKEIKRITDKDGQIALEGVLVTGVEYTLEESEAPKGYERLTGKVKFALSPEGAIVVKEAAGEFAVENQTIVVSDKLIRGHVTLTKSLKAEKNPSLPGVAFELYRVNGILDGSDEKKEDIPDTKITEFVTDEKGQWNSEGNLTEGLLSGSYYFKETKETADSTLLAEVIPFEIPDSSVDAGTKVHKEVAAENEIFQSAITLTKIDGTTKEPIAGGVKFKLTKTDCKADGTEYAPGSLGASYEKELEISKDGTVTFESLTKGTYLLEETAATGYDVSQPFRAVVTIGKDDNGKTIKVVADDDKHIKVENGTLTEEGIENERLSGMVTLTKRASVDGQVLTGVAFVLQKKEGDVYKECMTDLRTGNEYHFAEGKPLEATGETEDGSLKLAGLPWGTYRLIETAPADGFVVTDKKSGKAAETEFIISREQQSVKLGDVLNEETNLKLVKKDASTKDNLAEAVFIIKGERFAKADEKATEITCITDKNGEIQLNGLLVSGVEYTLEEKEAPEGYEPLKESLKFVLSKDGTFRLTQTSDGFELTKAGHFENILTIYNEPVKEAVPPTEEENAKTGDSAKALEYILLLIGAGSIATAVTVKTRRKKQ